MLLFFLKTVNIWSIISLKMILSELSVWEQMRTVEKFRLIIIKLFLTICIWHAVIMCISILRFASLFESLNICSSIFSRVMTSQQLMLWIETMRLIIISTAVMSVHLKQSDDCLSSWCMKFILLFNSWLCIYWISKLFILKMKQLQWSWKNEWQRSAVCL